MKRLGFLTGAIIAAIAVFAFNTWRHVSDDDRLLSVLKDHCGPYIVNGDTPFSGESRPIGVYDNVDIPDGYLRDQSAIVLDDRFLVSWGQVEATDQRACRVSGRQDGATMQAFNVDPEGFIGRVTSQLSILGDLQPTDPDWDGTQIVPALGWRVANDDFANAPQVLMTINGTLIPQVLITQRIPE